MTLHAKHGTYGPYSEAKRGTSGRIKRLMVENAKLRTTLEQTLPILDRAAIGRLIIRKAHETANEIRKILSEVTQC